MDMEPVSKTTPAAPTPAAKAPAAAPQGRFAGYSLVFSWDYEFAHPVADVWEIVTNTDRLNRAAGLAPIEYTQTPRPYGGTVRHGSVKELGFRLRWLEHDYEWVMHQHFCNEREYSVGPIKRLLSDWRFTPTPNGCKVTHSIGVVPGSPVGALIARRQIGRLLRRSFLQAYAWIDDFLSKKVAVAYRPTEQDNYKAPPGLRSEILERLAIAEVEPSMCGRAAEMITKAQPAELIRMRPLRKAKVWDIEPNAALSLFLRGTKVGIFVMQWDLLCPHCRGAQQRVSNLSDMQSDAQCDSCDTAFKVDFAKSVELTFEVHPGLRRVESAEYCVGGPQNTPHRLTQLRLPADTPRSGTMRLESGIFLVRSLHSMSRYRVNVVPGAPSPGEVHMPFLTGMAQEQELNLPPGEFRFHLDNQTPHEVVAVIERATWLEDVCTAAYITSLQEFRSLFSAQVLRSGERLAVGAMALLFTDLKSSTAMYERIGDSEAFALVREHFDILLDEVRRCDGCVVKTIGDAVMASFTQPANGVKAAIRIHKRMLERNALHPEAPLVLKIGIHYGACLAVNLNDRMDYFGSAVNIAARTEGQCEGGDVVMTHAMYMQPGVSEAVDSTGWRAERFKRALKGVSGDMELIRLRAP